MTHTGHRPQCWMLTNSDPALLQNMCVWRNSRKGGLHEDQSMPSNTNDPSLPDYLSFIIPFLLPWSSLHLLSSVSIVTFTLLLRCISLFLLSRCFYNVNGPSLSHLSDGVVFISNAWYFLINLIYSWAWLIAYTYHLSPTLLFPPHGKRPDLAQFLLLATVK